MVKQVFSCRGCQKRGNVIALGQLVWGTDFPETVARLCNEPAPSPSRPPARPKDPNSMAEAMRLWDEAQYPGGTVVERYLDRRGVLDVVPSGAFGEVLRFHPACKFGLTVAPCMVALVRSIVTNEPQGLMRTALSPDGRKISIGGIDRRALGLLKNGAIKLTEDAEVSTCLGVGEGPESTLSLRLTPHFGLSPVWALMSASGVEAFPVLAGIETLWVAVDADEPDAKTGKHAGQHAAAACSARWTAAGCEVFRVVPDALGTDLNDVMRGEQ
jgi:hypothetical protein